MLTDNEKQDPTYGKQAQDQWIKNFQLNTTQFNLPIHNQQVRKHEDRI